MDFEHAYQVSQPEEEKKLFKCALPGYLVVQKSFQAVNNFQFNSV